MEIRTMPGLLGFLFLSAAAKAEFGDKENTRRKAARAKYFPPCLPARGIREHG
jgi:hypothetical protein